MALKLLFHPTTQLDSQFAFLMTVVLTQFIVVSPNISGTKGTNINGKLQFTTSKVPNTTYFTSPVATQRVLSKEWKLSHLL